MNNKLKTSYIKRDFKKVKGWLYKGAIDIISCLNDIQSALNISGNIAEIGVHHGKLFILLYLFLKNDERGIAIDIFENQYLNLDKSGKGNKKIFIRNLLKFAKDISKLKIIENDSTLITKQDLIENEVNQIRFFSIDGGHTAELTLNDLDISKDNICKGGIIILDDYFNEEWPGVSEGTNKFMLKNPSIFPIAIGGNKIFFTNDLEICKIYQETLFNKFSKYLVKYSEVWGYRVLIINFRKLSIKEKFQKLIKWQQIKDTEVGKFIQRISSYI